MGHRWRLLLIFVPLFVLACSGGDGDGDDGAMPDASPTMSPATARATLPPFPTRAPQPSATPVTTYDAGARTEIDVIDEALVALQAGDADALLEQLSFHPYRCDNAPAGTVGSNPCPPGVPDGSPVDVIASGGCDVTFLARERANLVSDVRAFADTAAGQGVYAVVEVQAGRLASPLPLRYLIILSGGYTLLLDNAGITHLGLPCAGVGPAQLFHPADRAILPPL